MMRYNTSIPTAPAASLAGLLRPPANVNQDVYAAAESRMANDLGRQAQMANAEHMQRAASAQANMAGKGAQLMAGARQNAIDLNAARREQRAAYINNILRGLFT